MNRPVLNPFLSLRTFLTALIRGRAGYHVADAAYTAPGPTEVDGASFVGFLVARSAVARAGYPDGRLFIYGDDALYSLRLRRHGVRIGFDPGCGLNMNAARRWAPTRSAAVEGLLHVPQSAAGLSRGGGACAVLADPGAQGAELAPQGAPLRGAAGPVSAALARALRDGRQGGAMQASIRCAIGLKQSLILQEIDMKAAHQQRAGRGQDEGPSSARS